MNYYDIWPRFAALFDGLDEAFGSGRGGWIKRAIKPDDWLDHLEGKGPGIGIGPLRPDNTVKFAAIDLDKPDFEAAREMQDYIPGPSFVERSRSGNAHVWVFFKEPIEAWVPMGVLREATLAAGEDHVEVFPKNHDFNRVNFGNYINLPYHGNTRPVIDPQDSITPLRVDEFLDMAKARKNTVEAWRRHAQYLMVQDPTLREASVSSWGEQPRLHMCADYILSGEAGPIPTGHRQNVYFAVAKQLLNWEGCDTDTALDVLRDFNEHQPPGDMVSDSEIVRIVGNAERGRYTSTGCDDPVVLPFTHPDCPIAHPRR